MSYNIYGYKIEEELGEEYMVDFMYRSLSKKASAQKIISMTSKEFLENVHEASKTATDADASFDELNDMFEILFETSDGKKTYAIAVPRVPTDEFEEMLVTIVDGGPEAIEAFTQSLMSKDMLKTDVPMAEVSIEEDYSNEDLEDIASNLDKMAILVANNPKEAYAIELAAYTIRELKGDLNG